MRILVVVFLGLFLSACATTAKYEAVLNTWVGSSETDLVTKWGIPTSTYPLNDGKLLMYHQNGGSVSTHVGYGIYSTEHYSCKTTFTIDKGGIIRSWKWDGNACKSK